MFLDFFKKSHISLRAAELKCVKSNTAIHFINDKLPLTLIEPGSYDIIEQYIFLWPWVRRGFNEQERRKYEIPHCATLRVLISDIFKKGRAPFQYTTSQMIICWHIHLGEIEKKETAIRTQALQENDRESLQIRLIEGSDVSSVLRRMERYHIERHTWRILTNPLRRLMKSRQTKRTLVQTCSSL